MNFWEILHRGSKYQACRRSRSMGRCSRSAGWASKTCSPAYGSRSGVQRREACEGRSHGDHYPAAAVGPQRPGFSVSRLAAL